MRWKIFILIWVINLALITSCFSQNDTLKPQKILPYRHSAGILLNPYFRSFYKQYQKYPTVFAIRYGFQLKNNFQFGPEFYLMHTNVPHIKTDLYHVGLYARYSFLRKWNVQPFIEADGFYYHDKGLISFYGETTPVDRGGVDYFLAPGVTIYFWKKHIGLDLLFEWNHKYRNGMSLGPFEFSYRLTYHLNRIKFK